MTRVVGINQTAELRSILERVLLLKQQPDFDNAELFLGVESPRSRAVAPIPACDAKATLEKAKAVPDGEFVPISIASVLRTLIKNSSQPSASRSALLVEIEVALSGTSLAFSGPNRYDDEKSAAERKKYVKRMDRLRLRAEESEYRKLTKNIDKKIEDDVTMKSMSYATSVGMNMIVAPISFGVFMYFFAGQVFSFILGKERDGQVGGTDIKSVIAGVISGVIMLFIEMTLFVIRSHEMDASIRKKKKNDHANPFGYDKKKAVKTFHGEDKY